MVEKFKQPLNKRVIFNKPPNYDNEIHKSLAIMGTLSCPGRKMQPPVEAGARKALASSAPHHAASRCSAESVLPQGLFLTLALPPPLEWLAVGLSVYPWEEVHRDFSLIGTMPFGTARDILMAS